MMVPSSASELGPLSPLAQVDSLRAGCLLMGARQEESELGPLSPLAQVDSRVTRVPRSKERDRSRPDDGSAGFHW